MVIPGWHIQISKGGRVSLLKLLFLSNVTTLAFVTVFAGPASSEPHQVTVPEAWKQYISVGEMTVDSNAFYGIPWEFGLYPVVRLNLPVENLTAQTLYLKLNYRTESKQEGFGNSGMGVCYTLGPHEKRLIDAIVPIASVTRPIRFLIRMGEPSHSLDSPSSTETPVITIDPFEISHVACGDITLIKLESEDFKVKDVELAYSKELGNLVIFTVRNKTNLDLMMGAYVAVNDPNNIETKGVLARPRGFLNDSVEKIPANNIAGISVPYNIPPIGPNPVLVFTLFRPYGDGIKLGERDSRGRDVKLVAYGSFNLNRAAERGLCVITVHPPVEERAKLTEQKESEHFLFRYRPGSYAEQNINRAVREREEAYRKLSKVLQMELPVRVTIDLYPDMEAKALGSGTTWTPANTRSNKQICEVYNEEYQCDPYHELAHIFSYHFSKYGSNRAGIVEAFATYFEPNNMPVGEAKKNLEKKLREGKLTQLGDVLLSDSTSEEFVVAIDFLLRKDVEKFKEYFARITQSQERVELEKASIEIYKTDLKNLEMQWHDFIKQSNDT